MNKFNPLRRVLPLAVAALHIAGCSAEAQAPIIPAGEKFVCTPIAVYDGDGPVWCKEGPKVRLAGIAAREMDDSCRPGQPCPDASGIAARDRLVGLLGGSKGEMDNGHIKVAGGPLYCLSAGSGQGERTAAWCLNTNSQNLSCEILATGTVLRWPSYDPENICNVRSVQ